MALSSTQRYVAKARWLHWSMALLVVLSYVSILSRSQFSRFSEYRVLVVEGHYLIGMLLLGLAFFRLVQRWRHTPPPIRPPINGPMRVVANMTHYLMYGFLLLQPIMGMLTVLVEHGALPILFTDLYIPWPFPTSGRTAEYFEDLHRLFATQFYVVAGLHTAAALWHHFVRKDDTLQRML